MTDIQVGDLIRVTRKGHPERVAEGRVAHLEDGELGWAPSGYVASLEDWDIEVLDRPIDEALLNGAIDVFRRVRGFTNEMNDLLPASYRRDFTAVIRFILDYQKEHAK